MTLPTLFVHLQLKTYVPDELSGLVDALADPRHSIVVVNAIPLFLSRAYLSAQEKREEALQQMGVDELDELPLASELIQARAKAGSIFDSNASVRRTMAQQNGAGGTGQSGQNQLEWTGWALLGVCNLHLTGRGRTSASQSPCPGAKDQQLGSSPRTVTIADGHSTGTMDGKFQVRGKPAILGRLKWPLAVNCFV